jgi:hypothetical protein
MLADGLVIAGTDMARLQGRSLRGLHGFARGKEIAAVGDKAGLAIPMLVGHPHLFPKTGDFG